ncbi:MAG: cytochrome c3 family protein [Acidobacteriota bacterium]
MLVFKDAYSPGALSVAHARSDLSLSPAIAKTPNASCTTCHAVTSSMQQNCASCHTTTAFHSEVSPDKHMKVGLACTACHSEHHGRISAPASVANVACTSCHREGSGYVSPLTNKPLGTPHGGSFDIR